MLKSDKLAVYQELHMRLVYMDISFQLATQLISTTSADMGDTVEYTLETACVALRASACRIIIFSDTKKRYDYSYPPELAAKEKPAYEKFLCGKNLADVMEKLARNGIIELSYHDISKCKDTEKKDKNKSYFIIPISKKTLFDYSGFIEVSVAGLRNNNADIEFLKMLGVILLSAIKRIELESIIENERDMLSMAIELTTGMLEFDISARMNS